MKITVNFKFILYLIAIVFLSGCKSVMVYSDFNNQVNFSQFKTYAFYKPGIDEAEISDLDKQRILNAIEFNLEEKGLSKSETPDLLISIATEVDEDFYMQANPGWYWIPWYWGNPYPTGFYSTTSSILYIDLLDATNRRLIWQGIGKGRLLPYSSDKVERINLFVKEILAKYPPM